MTTSFPTSLDALTNPTGADNLNAPSHAAQHSNAGDAIEAIETKVGITSTGGATLTERKAHDFKVQSHRATVKLSADQDPIGSGIEVALFSDTAGTTEEEDTTNLHSTSTNQSRVLILRDGVYWITGFYAAVSANSGFGNIAIRLIRGAAEEWRITHGFHKEISSEPQRMSISALVRIKGSDAALGGTDTTSPVYVELMAKVGSATAAADGGGNTPARLSVVMLPGTGIEGS